MGEGQEPQSTSGEARGRGGLGQQAMEVARGDSASLTGSDCGTMRDTVIFAAFLLLLILAVVLLARFIVS
jgi:hypothetical protein